MSTAHVTWTYSSTDADWYSGDQVVTIKDLGFAECSLCGQLMPPYELVLEDPPVCITCLKALLERNKELRRLLKEKIRPEIIARVMVRCSIE